MKEPTIIELKPEQTCIVLDANGELVEVYIPDVPDDNIVPDNIVRIMEILLKNETNKIS